MKRLLLEIKREKYSVTVDTLLNMKLNVSVYERMNNPQLYSDIEQSIHNFIGKRVLSTTSDIILESLNRIEFNHSGRLS